MEPFKKPYLLLFNRVTDALELLETQGAKGLEPVKALLRQAQIDAEELYIDYGDIGFDKRPESYI